MICSAKSPVSTSLAAFPSSPLYTVCVAPCLKLPLLPLRCAWQVLRGEWTRRGEGRGGASLGPEVGRRRGSGGQNACHTLFLG
ncbi:hypothetical protein E2C01_036550 [Portunus trituberculatus]|uniref:Uncharacterized protein n=1 Tax=Portunus trituberculatus TaxID=210409 RepID=A0A5B7FBG8_PORTR|nr:hypothetical protein [Portunus trituberculatus]